MQLEKAELLKQNGSVTVLISHSLFPRPKRTKKLIEALSGIWIDDQVLIRADTEG
jgi:hypothetical protein